MFLSTFSLILVSFSTPVLVVNETDSTGFYRSNVVFRSSNYVNGVSNFMGTASYSGAFVIEGSCDFINNNSGVYFTFNFNKVLFSNDFLSDLPHYSIASGVTTQSNYVVSSTTDKYDIDVNFNANYNLNNILYFDNIELTSNCNTYRELVPEPEDEYTNYYSFNVSNTLNINDYNEVFNVFSLPTPRDDYYLSDWGTGASYSETYSTRNTLDNIYGLENIRDFLYKEGTNYNLGYNDGFGSGYLDGYNVGYSTAYSVGFNDGSSIDDTTFTIFNGILNVALVPINFFLSIFNFEILGINISAVVSALLTICVTIIIIKTFMGSKGGGE